ncbi:hypothetical protein RRG08_000927 [Elysia crispata]|uniref:Uncharacterized protein n=1 Tax=Elysia crispata TaxID=231223 RepID=A0AAE1DAE0_9GAST|nr:hypothetical protein RRG08_000927 [Elysia crispata]
MTDFYGDTRCFSWKTDSQVCYFCQGFPLRLTTPKIVIWRAGMDFPQGKKLTVFLDITRCDSNYLLLANCAVMLHEGGSLELLI